MDPKLRICNLKIWEPEMVTRNHQQWLLGSFAPWSPPPSEERVWPLTRTHWEICKTLPSQSPWYSSVQQILTVHLQGGYCSQHRGHGAEQHGLSLPLTFSRSTFLPCISLNFHQFQSALPPLFGSHMVWWKRQLEELVMVPALPLSGRESVGTIIKYS